jgi:hypothetical protein
MRRDARPRLTCGNCGVFWRRRDGRRRFSYFVSTGAPWPICAKNRVVWQRRDAHCRFPVLSNGNPWINCGNMASFDGVATLGVVFQRNVQCHPGGHLRKIWSFGGVVTLGVCLLASVYGVPRLLRASFAVRSRRRDTMRHDARRRFSNVVSNGIPRLIFAKYVAVATIGVPTLGVGLSQSLHMTSRGLYWPHLRFGVGVATIGACFPSSYQISRGSSTLNLASFRGVATLGFGLPASCLKASRGFSWPNLEFWVVARSASVFRRRVGSHPWASLH